MPILLIAGPMSQHRHFPEICTFSDPRPLSRLKSSALVCGLIPDTRHGFSHRLPLRRIDVDRYEANLALIAPSPLNSQETDTDLDSAPVQLCHRKRKRPCSPNSRR